MADVSARGLEKSRMSLPGSAIEQLQVDFSLRGSRISDLERENAELRESIEKQKETIETLELANATLRRRVESLEGVGS